MVTVRPSCEPNADLAYRARSRKNVAREQHCPGHPAGNKPFEFWRTSFLAWLVTTGLFGLFENVAGIPASLGEHAALAWVNDQIAEYFGIHSPSISEVVRMVLEWAPAAMLALICVSGWIYAFRVRRQPGHGASVSPAGPITPVALLPEQPPSQTANIDAIRARINRLASNGGLLLNNYSFVKDSSEDSRSKLIAWLIAASEVTPALMASGRTQFAEQITRAIDDPTSGPAYKKVQLVHAIMSELTGALADTG